MTDDTTRAAADAPKKRSRPQSRLEKARAEARENAPAAPVMKYPVQYLRIAFGRKLKALLEERGWKQADLAKASGLRRDSVHNYVNGKNVAGDDHLKKIADAFGVTTDELLPNQAMVESRGAKQSDPRQFETSFLKDGRLFLRFAQPVTMVQAARILEALVGDQAEATMSEIAAERDRQRSVLADNG